MNMMQQKRLTYPNVYIAFIAPYRSIEFDIMDIPRGDAFPPEYTWEDLIDLYLKEKDSKAKVRLLSVIYRKEGLKYKK